MYHVRTMNSHQHRKVLQTFYKYQVWIFKLFALWKLDEDISPRWRRLHQIYFWHIVGFWVLLFDSTLLIQFISNITNLNEVIKVFFIFATALSVLAKFGTIKANNALYHYLIESIHWPIFQPVNAREQKLFVQSEHLSRSVRNSYCLISLCALNVVLLTQYIVDNSELPLSTYNYNINLESQWRYVLMYLYQYLAVSLCCYMNIAFDSISASLLIHVKGQLDILGDRLQHLGKNLNSDDNLINQQLKDCIKYYTEILKLAQIIEDLVSFPISIQIFCSVLVLVANFYAMSFLSQPGDYANFVKFLIYQICMLSQIFILCYFSNEVSLKSSELSYSLYTSEWVSWNKPNRKLVLLMMTRFDIPVSIRSINRNFSFNLAAFTSIVNSSYSYFALLKKINS